MHPAIWTDDRTAAMSRDERLMFVGMITVQDDEQRLLATPRHLRGEIYPHDEDVTEKRVEFWRDMVCIRNENVVLYRVGKIEYIWLGKATNYQKPDHPTPSKLPSPKSGVRVTARELLAKYSAKYSAKDSRKARRVHRGRLGEALAHG